MSDILEISQDLKLVKATGREFTWGNQSHQILYGEIFYLKKDHWDHVEGPYSLKKKHVQSGEFREWLNAGMVYILHFPI